MIVIYTVHQYTIRFYIHICMCIYIYIYASNEYDIYIYVAYKKHHKKQS